MQNREGERLMNKSQMNKTLIPLTKSALGKIRIRAIRRGIWFKVLNRLERASIDLTIKVVERVRSSVLTKILTSIVEKLSEAMESRVARMMRDVGSNLARKMSLIAQKWGNKSAVKWKTDFDFIQYLTVMSMNASPMFNE